MMVLAGCLAGAVAAQGDRVTRGTVVQATDVVVSEQRVLLVHSVRSTDALLPPYVARLDVRFPPGTQVRTAGFPRCNLAALQARGVTACPRQARVGTASIVGRSFLDSSIGSKVTLFNGERIRRRPAVLMYVHPEKGPAFVAVGTLSGSRRTGVRLDLGFPTIKILAGTGPDAVLSDFALRFDTGFVSAPCRAPYRVTSHFFNGEPSLTSTDRARCR